MQLILYKTKIILKLFNIFFELLRNTLATSILDHLTSNSVSVDFRVLLRLCSLIASN